MHIGVNILRVGLSSPTEINSPFSNVSCCNVNDETCKTTITNNTALTATSVITVHGMVEKFGKNINLDKKYCTWSRELMKERNCLIIDLSVILENGATEQKFFFKYYITLVPWFNYIFDTTKYFFNNWFNEF